MKPETGIVRILKQEGTEFLCVMPVGNITPSASKEKLRIIMMRNERFAVGLADGYSRASNGKKIGVFNIQGGAYPVGAEIAQGAVAQARLAAGRMARSAQRKRHPLLAGDHSIADVMASRASPPAVQEKPWATAPGVWFSQHLCRGPRDRP